ncbi:MAG: hypothetical protein KJ949_00490 [Nanoarchaeota archaeon]|nr:hypothetical protein [Nanoarchaeota archaeon]MBU4308216.1 hypothetical protein [Nanoarchaeota archaeon]
MKDFQYFINQKIVRKQNPNKARADFLIKEAEQNYSFLLEMFDKIGVSEKNANNFVKNSYDMFMGLIRAKMFLEGYISSGFGAHEAEISYMKVLGFNEEDVQFADKIRFFRNGMLYYGTILDKEYAEKVIVFTKNLFFKLKRILNLK